jgi:hypothetical protein
MTKQFFLVRLPVFICLTLIISAGCNNADKTVPPESVAPADSLNKTTETIVPAGPAAFGGKLNSLWTEDTLFRKLDKKKVVFAFNFADTNNVLMDGWYLRKGKNSGVEDTFDLAPDIQLKKGILTDTLYGPGTYFGNVVLQKKDIKRIIYVLDSTKFTKVIFYPEISHLHIGYKVYVGNNQYEKDVSSAVAVKPTNVVANPSPPKEY